ncbi:MAG: ribbon-helix-helix protein, CopG family [Candidatus Acidiferrales bacterium]
MKPALIHFRPGQRVRLARKARRAGKSVSEAVRDAVDIYLEIPAESEEELAVLASEARLSIERSIQRLDRSIANMDRVLKRARRSR